MLFVPLMHQTVAAHTAEAHASYMATKSRVFALCEAREARLDAFKLCAACCKAAYCCKEHRRSTGRRTRRPAGPRARRPRSAPAVAVAARSGAPPARSRDST
jgi:hypothetical protein